MAARDASHAGSWYSDDRDQLNQELKKWLDAVDRVPPRSILSQSTGSGGHFGRVRAVIAPHAGYAYSGPTAAFAYQFLDVENIKRIFILGPSHHVYLDGCSVTRCKVTEDLEKTGKFGKMSRSVDEREHSIEMHLPYIYHILQRAQRVETVTIVPILVGSIAFSKEDAFAKLLAPYINDPDNAFVLSSDFCHWGRRFDFLYLPDDCPSDAIHEGVEQLDRMGMSYIENVDLNGFRQYLSETENTICGRHPISLFLSALTPVSADHREMQPQKFLQKRIGVLGGGQLGRMLVEAAAPLDLTVTTLDPSPDCPVSHVLPNQRCLLGDFRDAQDVKRLMADVDVLTFEIEHINVDAVEEGPKIPVEPHPQTMRLIQDKFLQKQYVSQHGVPVTPFCDVSNMRQLQDLATRLGGYPYMLKSKKLAYDGRGNYVVRNAADIQPAFQYLCGNHGQNDTTNDDSSRLDLIYAEKWVSFEKELAVMVAKSVDGSVVAYPCVETVQENNICRFVYAPALVDAKVAEKARHVAMDAIRHFPGAGVFGVELFLLSDGSVVLNEIAPRPHNSGHYTIEACYTSQFEQHLRAVASLPLGCPDMKCGAAIMINILGTADGEEGMLQLRPLLHQALRVPGASVHWYGKSSCRKGRKMGHITLTGPSMAKLLPFAAQLTQHNPTLSSSTSVASGCMSPVLTTVPQKPLVGIIMGSDSDLPKMKPAAEVLERFGVSYQLTVVSAHRTPDRLMEYAKSADEKGLKCIIAGAGGAAHLPGMCAAMTPLPVIGVPVALKHLDGVDSLHSIVQMPRGVPVACVAIDNATNAGLLAVRILSASDPQLVVAMKEYQESMRVEVMNKVDRLERDGWKNY